MATTYDTSVNNMYEEADNSSEVSSSTSSFGDKKISFEETLEKDNNSNNKENKRAKRNSFIKIFKKDEKEKEKEKEKKEEGSGLSRTLSGIFAKDKGSSKDNSKRTSTYEGEQHLRPTTRTSSNSDNSKRRSFVFFSDDDDNADNITEGKKSRQNSNSFDDKDKKKERRISVNLSKILSLGMEDNKSSPKTPKQESWEDNFLEPVETSIPKSPKNPSNPIFNNINNNEYVESPKVIRNNNSIIPSKDESHINDNNNQEKHKVDSPTTPKTPKLIVTPTEKTSRNIENLTVSTSNLEQQHDLEQVSKKMQELESLKTQYEAKIAEQNDMMQQMKHLTQTMQRDDNSTNEQVSKKMQELESLKSQYEAKIAEQNDMMQQMKHLKETMLRDDNTKDSNTNIINERLSTKLQEIEENNKSLKTQFETQIAEKNDQISKFNSIEQMVQQIKHVTEAMQRGDNNKDSNTNDIINEHLSKKLQEMEEINKSLKSQLEAQVAEGNSKFNSMEQIIQQQINLSKSLTETMQRLESQVVQKEEVDTTRFEDTIRRLENKIDRQNNEIDGLKSFVEQLKPSLLLLENIPNISNTSRMITQGENLQEERQLIPNSLVQSPQQICSRNIPVNISVVNSLYDTAVVSAKIATSVLYAVYVRPVVGLVKVVQVVRGGV